MINYVNFSDFNSDSIDKQITLTFSNGDVMTNTNIEQEAFQLKESLCSGEQLEFGACEASELTFTVWGVYTSHAGQTVTATIVLDGDVLNPLTIGTYKVIKDTASADRTKRTMTCYDALYDVLNADVAGWYNTLFPDSSTTKTIKQIRDSFFTHFGITQESATLVNDELSVGKTIQPTSLSGKDVLRAICELNGVFGHITRANEFRYVSLKNFTLALYPADDLYPGDDVFPAEDGETTEIGANGNYISLDYSDYTVQQIDKVVIRQEDTDIGAIVGSGTNALIIQGNFLVYGMDAGDLATIANAIYSKVSGIWYRPFEVDLRGNLCMEVGDGVYMGSRYEVIYGYILQRVYKGVQAPRDTLIADGNELRNDQVNAVNTEIIRLRGQQAVLKKSVDEVSVELTRQLDSSVEGSYAYQTAQEIGARVETTTFNNALNPNISGSYANLTAQAINARVETTVFNNALNPEISGSYANMTAQQIALKVSKSGLVSDLNDEIGSSITIEANHIGINSTGALTINTTNFGLDAYGNVRIAGHVDATSGSIGGFDISSNRIESDPDAVGYGNPGVAMQVPVSSSTVVFAAGYTNPESLGSAPFQVMANGRVIARNAYISGGINATSGYIGEFEISYEGLQTDPYYVGYGYRGVRIKSGANASDTEYAIAVGYYDPDNIAASGFKVNAYGNLFCGLGNFNTLELNSVKAQISGSSATYTTGVRWKQHSNVQATDWVLVGA